MRSANTLLQMIPVPHVCSLHTFVQYWSETKQGVRAITSRAHVFSVLKLGSFRHMHVWDRKMVWSILDSLWISVDVLNKSFTLILKSLWRIFLRSELLFDHKHASFLNFHVSMNWGNELRNIFWGLTRAHFRFAQAVWTTAVWPLPRTNFTTKKATAHISYSV